MYGEDTNPTGIDSQSVYMAAACRQPIDEWINPLGAIKSFATSEVDKFNRVRNMTPEQKAENIAKNTENLRNAISNGISKVAQKASEKIPELGDKALEGTKAVISGVGNVTSELVGHTTGTGFNTALDTAKTAAKVVGEKNGKTVAGLAAGAVGLYGAHNLVQHLRRNAESDRAIRRKLDSDKELFRYKESVRQEIKARERALRNMSREEIAAAKDRERKELLKLQSLAHQADVEGRNLTMTGYSPYIKESAVKPVYGKEETYKDKGGNEHVRRNVTFGDKTYRQDRLSSDTDYGPHLTPVRDDSKQVTFDDAQKEATHDRNVNRAATAISVAGPAILVAAGAVKHRMDKKKKEQEEEERRLKEAEEAHNARIDVRVRKALEGKKSKPKNESASIYKTVSVARDTLPEESMASILEDAIRVRMDYDNTHRNFGSIADEYVPAQATSPWLG